jgi:hypothetical protein
MIQDILYNSKNNKSLIGFNLSNGDSTYYAGYVLDYTDEVLVLQNYTRFGIIDGVSVHILDDLKNFEVDTVYLNCLKYLIDNQLKMLSQMYEYTEPTIAKSELIQILEQYIANREVMLKFEMKDAHVYYGYLEWVDDLYFSINSIDVDGLLIGRNIFKHEELKLFWVDDLECRRRLMISKLKIH